MALITLSARPAGDRSGIHIINRHFAKQALMRPLEAGASGLVVRTQDLHARRLRAEGGGDEARPYRTGSDGWIAARAMAVSG